MRFQSVFDSNFFIDFIAVRNRKYEARPEFARERLEDFERLFASGGIFSAGHQWCAWIHPRGRVIASLLKTGGNFGSIGWFEAEDAEATAELLSAACDWLKKIGCVEARGPIQGNVFFGSRFRVGLAKGHTLPGEWVQDENYLDYWSRAGFSTQNNWGTYLVNKRQIFGSIILGWILHRRKSNLKVRQINFENWNQEVRSLYEVVIDSYSSLPDYEPLSFEEFEYGISPLKIVCKSEFSLVAEEGNRAMGFLIAVEELGFPANCAPIHLLYIGKRRVLEKKSNIDRGRGLGSWKPGVTAILGVELCRRIPHLLFRKAYLSFVLDQSPIWRVFRKPAAPFRTYKILKKRL